MFCKTNEQEKSEININLIDKNELGFVVLCELNAKTKKKTKHEKKQQRISDFRSIYEVQGISFLIQIAEVILNTFGSTEYLLQKSQSEPKFLTYVSTLIGCDVFLLNCNNSRPLGHSSGMALKPYFKSFASECFFVNCFWYFQKRVL